MNPSRRVVHLRIASLRTAVAAVGVALALAACSATNPATIATPFNPGEGGSGQLGGEQGNGGGDGNYQGNGGIKLRNFLVVSQGSDQPGVIAGGISNDTGQTETVQLQLTAKGSDGQEQQLGSTSVQVKPGQFVQVGNPAGVSGSASPSGTQPDSTAPAAGPYVWFQVPSVPGIPGSVLTMNARTSGLGGTSFSVPVYPPLEYYANLTPTSAAPTPSVSASLSPTGSPSTSPNPSGAASQTPTESGASGSTSPTSS
ncbi:MAG TPA: hypothetical protein VEV65_08670 [Kineosporiaceae bacterium]|nr:hypothetical protein [Kineosporiaceae bacterium]